MTESEWLQKAGTIHRECAEKTWGKNGSKKITQHEATIINELQHAIGSHHGIHLITYSEARTSLDEMFEIVKRGMSAKKKVGSLSKG